MFYILINAGALIFLFMLGVWALYRYTNNPSIVDIFWGLGILSLACMYTYLGKAPIERKFLALILVAVWGIRLSSMIAWRQYLHGEDTRYKVLSKNWKNPKIGFLINYYFQGLLMLIISSPVYFIVNAEQSNSLLDFIAMLLGAGAIYGEIQADNTLKRFKQQQTGGICKVGLWAKCRHPNYFFEVCLWSVFFLWGVSYNTNAIYAVASPLTIYIIVRWLTGPLTERLSVERYGDRYKAYQQETHFMWPF